MALIIENTIDLTAYADNPAPKVVSQLSIIHESDKDSRTYSYHDYPEVVWGEPGQRICGNRIERLGVKAFPAIGAIAFYKLMHRKITRIVAPVNRKSKKQEAPTLDAQVNLDDTVTFTITPPDKPKYACYRIVMQYDIYIEEYVTYDLELTVPAPHITGEYRCYAVGYGDEGQLLSKDSNVITLSLIGKSAIFQRPYYMKSELTAAERDADQRYQELENYTETLEQRIRALEERIPPEGGNDNG